ncbi:MAG: molybdopterin-binding protein, partial [Dehalococcoidales bacterium]|nr:molybdopterin-binding protein [Dehalococcoidales bacterium]
ITSGGCSAGDYEVVKDILAKEGEIGFWTVRVKPGKPLAFGTIRGNSKTGKIKKIPHLGLPGNPVSSMVTFDLFVRPAMLKMMGKTNLIKPTMEVILEDSVTNNDGRRIMSRAVVSKRDGRYFAKLTGPQGSGILTSMSLANALVIIPENKARMNIGDVVKAIMLDWGEVQ